ncbi:peroxiredoxin family protein [Planococcus salinus]|uniref:TlpA family protein disulfide reductase n=1 Tax=Planococcus salinus TaxID=1848460 RepID=A0A3M8P8C6_9BACL|nr:redoxin domain-containing protein [Planococcus salinus]RNF39872.1 TlpA family protein disulfide reductase [Planococcus salinus]
MKKTVFILLIAAMLFWAVFDFVTAPEEAADTDSDTGLAIGQTAPDFELTTAQGETMRLSDYRGQKVFINFWATWCPPCRAEMPDMQKLYEQTDIEILAVNLTDTESSASKAAEFVEELGLTFPIPMDEESTVSDLYQVRAYPTSYMIDTQGRISYVAPGALNYDKMLQEVEKMD